MDRPSPDAARLILAAAAYAAAELLLTLGVGRFFDWGRAEALLFFAFRPWLLLAAALLVSRYALLQRLLFYVLALLLAAAGETLLLLNLGASNPWPEALRGLAAGALVLVPIDLGLQLGRRWGWKGAGVAGVAIAASMLAGALRPYDAFLLPEPKATAQTKPVLMMMTGLPIVWGESGPFDPNWSPAESYMALQEGFRVELLDTLDARTLSAGRLLLLAQPQRLSPSELAAVDDWVQRGGRAMILADPHLSWPSELPLGDIRRPPPVSLLAPLLLHWGLAVENSGPPGRRALRWGDRKLIVEDTGRIVIAKSACRLLDQAWAAECRLGLGRALILAEADLMRDELWAPAGRARHRRIADNAYFVAAKLDRLAGVKRAPLGGQVEWIDPDAGKGVALSIALLPPLLAAFAALVARRRKRG